MVEQNIVICRQWWAHQLFAEAEGWGKLLICETLTNHDILRWPSSIIVLSFDHGVCFLRNIFGKRSDLPFSRKSDRKKEKSVVLFTLEQNSICSQKQLNDIAHEHTIICRQLFAGHLVGSRPMQGKKHLHRIIIIFTQPASNSLCYLRVVCLCCFNHERQVDYL